MKKQKENSHEGITWSEMGKQNVQAEKVYNSYHISVCIGNEILITSCFRLQHAGRLHSQSVSLCIAVHGSKIPLCLSTIFPYQPTTAVLLPSFLLMSPALLVFLFTFVVCKLIEAPGNLSRNEVKFWLSL